MAKSQIDSEGSSDWQLEHTGLLQRTTYLLESELWSDCTFLVGPTESVVKAHRVVLSIASPVFSAMFYGELAQKDDIQIPDMQPNVFRTLLRFLYTDKLNLDLSKDWEQDKVVELLFGLYYGAKKYMLPHLEKESIKCLTFNLNPKNVCKIYKFANFFEENELMEKCITIISKNTKDVLDADSFENADLQTVNTIFSLDHLTINSELVLFDAAARYFKAHEKRTPWVEGSSFLDIGLPSNKNVAVNSGNRFEKKEKDKLTVRAIMEKIRFLTLSLEQFAEGPAQSSLLSESEAFAVLMNIASMNVPNTPMPKKKEKDKLTVRAIMEKIRFLTLSPEQFAQGPAQSSLLTESEAFAVLMNIASSNVPNKPMPSDFSKSRVPRKTESLNSMLSSQNVGAFGLFGRPAEQKSNNIFA